VWCWTQGGERSAHCHFSPATDTRTIAATGDHAGATFGGCDAGAIAGGSSREGADVHASLVLVLVFTCIMP